MLKKSVLLSSCLMLCVSEPALAVSKKLRSPSVSKGVWEVENFGTVESSNGQVKWKNVTELEYGITDRLKVEIYAKTEKEEGGSLEYEETEFELTYEVTGDEYPIQSAVQGAYEINHLGDSDKIETKLLLQHKSGMWKHRLNVGLDHEVGEKSTSGIEAGLAWGTYYSFDKVKVGGEYYADFGRLKDDLTYDEQEHHIGPVIGFDVPVGTQEVEVKFGYLAGISSAASDSVFKYEFEIEF